ncbi:MAG TPA: hypothetical protein VK766_06085 [Cytophagaceae bacterium]|nr:hypothetical protein [Cytophagaceae bacterium]
MSEKEPPIYKSLRDKFENFGNEPPVFIWANIEKGLAKDKKKNSFRKGLYPGVVVLISLLSASAVYLVYENYKKENFLPDNTTISDKKTIRNNSYPQNNIKNGTITSAAWNRNNEALTDSSSVLNIPGKNTRTMDNSTMYSGINKTPETENPSIGANDINVQPKESYRNKNNNAPGGVSTKQSRGVEYPENSSNSSKKDIHKKEKITLDKDSEKNLSDARERENATNKIDNNSNTPYNLSSLTEESTNDTRSNSTMKNSGVDSFNAKQKSIETISNTAIQNNASIPESISMNKENDRIKDSLGSHFIFTNPSFSGNIADTNNHIKTESPTTLKIDTAGSKDTTIKQNDDKLKEPDTSTIKPKHRLIVSVYGAPEKLLHRLIQYPNIASSTSRAYSLGINLGYTLSNHLSLETGIGLLHSHTNYRYHYNTTVTNTTTTITYITTYDSLGGTIITPVTSTTTTNSTQNNTAQATSVYTYMYIPVDINYKIGSGKIFFNVSGGLAPAYLIRNKESSIADSTYSRPQTKNLNLFLTMSGSINYHISRYIVLYAAPVVKYGLFDLYSNTHPSFIGINGGIRIDISRK